MWLGLFVVCSWLGGGQSLDSVNQGVQQVYDVIVKPGGTVDYATLSERTDLMEKLDDFVQFYHQFDPISLDNERAVIAAFSNAYNVFTLVGVMQAWPVESVRKIHPLFGFFTKKKFTINGKKISLNGIEKGQLQPRDARIHFIINCASISCPEIQPEVLTAENIEAIMNRSSLAFLMDDSKNVFDSHKQVWHLSKVFDWYRKDWGGEGGVIAFIRATYPQGADWQPKKIIYQKYNWHLNGPTQPKSNRK